MATDTESHPLEDLRSWIEKILEECHGLEFHSFRICKTRGRSHFASSYKVIGSVPAPRESHKFIMPDDIGYVIGYCIAAADLDLREFDDQKVYYRIRARGKNDKGTFENNKHFMRVSYEGGIPL
jgi:hypothetical protein